MEKKYNFIKMNVDEFEQYLSDLKVARTILCIQQHHTLSPNYALFTGSNHFELQNNMKNYHIQTNGWSDIGQHFTIFPDGTIMTGRNMENSPACIYLKNQNCVCIENLGNFDDGRDVMKPAQRDAIIRATAAICVKFGIPITSNSIVYHHWFRLSDGVRNNGAGGNKSCPGTNFFGGNKVTDCENNFLPLVRDAIGGDKNKNSTDVIKYVSVTASFLNIRTAADVKSAKVSGRPPAILGAVLRVYEEKGGWYRISGSENHWVLAAHTCDVKRATVTADSLNVRDLPSKDGLKVGSVSKGEETFIYEETNGWCRIGLEPKWVSNQFLNV